MLNVERLRALHAVAAHGSILAAADTLHVTTSAVSQQLAKLEREVVAAALARGANAYMIKPCMPEVLRATVHAVLGLK